MRGSRLITGIQGAQTYGSILNIDSLVTLSMSLQESDRQIEIAIVKDLNLKYLVRISLSQFEVWDLVRDSGLTDVLYESTRLDSIEWVTGFRVWKTHYLRIGL